MATNRPDTYYYPRRVVVIGVGDEECRDDAVGPIVARRVKRLAGDSVRVIEGSGEPEVTMADWDRDADVAVVCGAVTGEVGGGTVRYFEVNRKPVPSSFFHRTSPTSNGASTIERLRALGHIPDRMIVYGIEGENFEKGEGLSPLVNEAAGHVVQSILAMVGLAGLRA